MLLLHLPSKTDNSSSNRRMHYFEEILRRAEPVTPKPNAKLAGQPFGCLLWLIGLAFLPRPHRGRPVVVAMLSSNNRLILTRKSLNLWQCTICDPLGVASPKIDNRQKIPFWFPQRR